MLPTAPILPASLSLPPSAFLSSRPHIQRLMAAGMLFRQTPSHTQTLLIRRAPTDSYPLKWEIPGGSVSSRKDASVLAGAAREVLEETGLTVKRFLYPVGMVEDDVTAVLQGLGISPEEEVAQNNADDDALTVTFRETGNTWGKVTLVADVQEDLSADDVVRLREGEHDTWAWATEEEVRSGRWDGDGGHIEFVSKGVWRTMLEGFRLRREREAERLMNRFPGKAFKGDL